MKRTRGTRLVVAAAVLATSLAGCATTAEYSTTWTEPSAGGNSWSRKGRVVSVQEIVRRQEGHPAAGAVTGALLGGLLFRGRGPASLFGAAAGAAAGAAVSQGGPETRTYQVMVRFEDGTSQLFVYPGYPPFAPGQPVTWTPQGLAPG